METAIKMKIKAPISFASFKSCTSPSFLKFKSTIINWFQIPTP